jgi:hypothetical protein
MMTLVILGLFIYYVPVKFIFLKNIIFQLY